jgi:RNA polymerase sigma-70 factor (ECF subfamily)
MHATDDSEGLEADLRSKSDEPDRRLARHDDGRALARALATLSPIHALAFELAVVQQRPYAEIAGELAIPVGTVKSRVFHALRHLREALEGDAR